MKLTKFHLRYYPPGIILEYVQGGVTKNKAINLFELSSGPPNTRWLSSRKPIAKNVDINTIADELIQTEVLLTAEIKEQLVKCLETLKLRLQSDGTSGKRFYIHKTLHTHILPLTNTTFDKLGNRKTEKDKGFHKKRLQHLQIASIYHFMYSKQHNRCLTGSYDRTCKMWDVKTGKEIMTLYGHENVVYSVTFNLPVCDKILTGSFDKTAKLWDAESGECIETFWGHCAEVVATLFSPRCETVATASMDTTAKLFNVETGHLVSNLAAHTGEVVALHFDRNDSNRLITGSFDSSIIIWDARTQKAAAVLNGHTAEISNCLFSWDSKLIASSSLDGSAKIWDARQRTSLATIDGHKDEVLDVCFDWVGKRIATASSDNTARIFDVRTDFRLLATMNGHKDEISKVTFSPAGGSLLTASGDCTARLWNSDTGNCIQVLSGHFGEIFSCCFNYIGDTVLTASKDNTCRIWR